MTLIRPNYLLTPDLLTLFNGARQDAQMEPVKRLPAPIALMDGYMLEAHDPFRLKVPTGKGRY